MQQQKADISALTAQSMKTDATLQTFMAAMTPFGEAVKKHSADIETLTKKVDQLTEALEASNVYLRKANPSTDMEGVETPSADNDNVRGSLL